MKSDFRMLIVLTLTLLVGCAGSGDFTLGVPNASEFDEPVPVRMSDVQIGVTGDTGLGPDDLPMVELRIESEHRDRIREDCDFVLRRGRLGTGALFVDVIPGSGAPVESGHHFVARRADVTGAARDWWNDLMESTQDGAVREKLRTLREQMDALAESGQERWEEARPELEAETDRLLEELRSESDEAAEDLREWWDEAVERVEKTTDREKVH